MGQKVNPYGIRLGINKTWSSRWFSKNEYTKLLHQDLKIKQYVSKKLKNASISKINIERNCKNWEYQYLVLDQVLLLEKVQILNH